MRPRREAACNYPLRPEKQRQQSLNVVTIILDPDVVTYDIVETNKVLEGERSGQSGLRGQGLCGDDVEELQGVLWLLLLLLQGILSCLDDLGQPTHVWVWGWQATAELSSGAGGRYDIKTNAHLSCAAGGPEWHLAAEQCGQCLPPWWPSIPRSV